MVVLVVLLLLLKLLLKQLLKLLLLHLLVVLLLRPVVPSLITEVSEINVPTVDLTDVRWVGCFLRCRLLLIATSGDFTTNVMCE